MKHIYRFLAQAQSPQLWEIRDQEFIHLKQVLRLKLQDSVEVFDGKGLFASGQIQEIHSKYAVVECSPAQMQEKMRPQLILALGALKPGFIDDLLPMFVELNADELHVFCQDGVSKNRISDKAVERWERISQTSAKQCRRAHLPLLKIWSSLLAMLEGMKNLDAHRFVLDPHSNQYLSQAAQNPQKDIFAIIGGEKGFSPNEEQILQAQEFLAVSLGPLILRAYTASIAACVILSNVRMALGQQGANT